MRTEEVFQLKELFLLGEATEQTLLFGLPDKAMYLLTDPHYLDDAQKLLTEKGIFGQEGHFTDGGFLVARALKEYAESRKYVQINNLLIAFSELEQDTCIVLTEIELEQAYKLTVIDKYALLKELFSSLEIVRREPLADEKEFLLTKVRNRERRVFEKMEKTEPLFHIETFDINQLEPSEENPTHWLYYIEEDKLYAIQPEQGLYYRVSQYWFMRELFQALEIPYETEEGRVVNG